MPQTVRGMRPLFADRLGDDADNPTCIFTTPRVGLHDAEGWDAGDGGGPAMTIKDYPIDLVSMWLLVSEEVPANRCVYATR